MPATAALATPIDQQFTAIKHLLEDGARTVRALSIGGEQTAAEALARRLAGIRMLEIGDIEEMRLSEATTLLADIARQIQDAIRNAAPPAKEPPMPEPPPPDPTPVTEPVTWLPLKAAAAQFGVHPGTLWGWVTAGKVPSQPDPHFKSRHLVDLAAVQVLAARPRRARRAKAVAAEAAHTVDVAPKTTTAVAEVPLPVVDAQVVVRREKPQVFAAIFAEPQWWHDPKAPQNPRQSLPVQVNDWSVAS